MTDPTNSADDRMPNPTGVIYRNGPLTSSDYDEAIQDLIRAKTQLQGQPFDGRGCEVCTDSGHLAYYCHHNPLAVARRVTERQSTWRCFHCGEEFNDVDEAREHFGPNERADAACQTNLARPPADDERRKALAAFENVVKNFWGRINLYISRADLETIRAALLAPPAHSGFSTDGSGSSPSVNILTGAGPDFPLIPNPAPPQSVEREPFAWGVSKDGKAVIVQKNRAGLDGYVEGGEGDEIVVPLYTAPQPPSEAERVPVDGHDWKKAFQDTQRDLAQIKAKLRPLVEKSALWRTAKITDTALCACIAIVCSGLAPLLGDTTGEGE